MKTLTFYDIAYQVDERYEDWAVFKPFSSNVDFFGHRPEPDKETQSVFVQFNNGGTYLYGNIPTATIMRASLAESIGKFIRAEISGKYTSVKLEGQILTRLK